VDDVIAGDRELADQLEAVGQGLFGENAVGGDAETEVTVLGQRRRIGVGEGRQEGRFVQAGELVRTAFFLSVQRNARRVILQFNKLDAAAPGRHLHPDALVFERAGFLGGGQERGWWLRGRPKIRDARRRGIGHPSHQTVGGGRHRVGRGDRDGWVNLVGCPLEPKQTRKRHHQCNYAFSVHVGEIGSVTISSGTGSKPESPHG
jgi:hypothetical protein